MIQIICTHIIQILSMWLKKENTKWLRLKEDISVLIIPCLFYNNTIFGRQKDHY